MCPLTVLSVSQSLLSAVSMADLILTVGVEFARKLHAVFLADPTFPVSVESFIVSWTQSSWLMRLSYHWWSCPLELSLRGADAPRLPFLFRKVSHVAIVPLLPFLCRRVSQMD